jgi:hypothetical protein
MLADSFVGDFTFCRYGRIHTVVTRLHRKLRPFLHVDGEPVVNIDIANSQPLMVALLLTQYRRAGGRFFNMHTFGTDAETLYLPLSPAEPNAFAHAGSNSTQKNTHRIGGCVGWGGVPAGLASDEALYVRLCEGGELYEYLRQAAGLQHVQQRAFKKRCFHDVFYGRNSVYTALTAAFEREFPNVWAVIRAAKRKDHAHLARMMQTYESSLMINRVCRRLMDEYPDIPVITLHDSILTTAAHVETVQRMIQAEFADVGLSPKLKVERPAAVSGPAANTGVAA